MSSCFQSWERVIFLDEDVVVQRDLTSLWHLDLHGLVMGAVSSLESNHGLCLGKTFSDYINVSNPLISSSSLDLQRTQCAWLEGMNIFDLRAWRKNNITRTYQRWLKLACSSRSTIQCRLHSEGAKLWTILTESLNFVRGIMSLDSLCGPWDRCRQHY